MTDATYKNCSRQFCREQFSVETGIRSGVMLHFFSPLQENLSRQRYQGVKRDCNQENVEEIMRHKVADGMPPSSENERRGRMRGRRGAV